MTAAATAAAAGLTPLPPKDAIRFFEGKGLKAGFAWQDVWGDEHAHGFTVAKMMQTDMLADVQASLTRALADGTTFADWKKSAQPMLEARGWWGRSQMTDPLTGEVKSVQLGSPRRLRIIYDTNMRTARAAGMWDRIQERKVERPWLRYAAVLDEQTRADHRAYHGTILPVDHPWWRTHYPPNGWKCRCTVQQLSARDLEQYGWKVSEQPPAEPLVKYVNARTGEEQMIPAGIDPGFANNVGTAGRVAQSYRLLADKLAAAPPDIARRAGWALLKSPAFERFIAGAQAGEKTGWWPLPPPAAAVKALGADDGAILYLSDETAAAKSKHPLALEDWRALPELLETAEPIPSKKPLHWGFLAMREGRHYLIIVKRTKPGDRLFLQTFHFSDAATFDAMRRRGYAAAEIEGMF